MSPQFRQNSLLTAGCGTPQVGRVRGTRRVWDVSSALHAVLNPRVEVTLLGLCFCLCLACTGCVSKAKARAQAQAAFIAGQQQAMTHAQQAQSQPQDGVVRINGPVRQNILPWVPGMTLASALLAADYSGPDPTMIYIARDQRAIQIHPQELLTGRDIQLLSGDVVQIMTGPMPGPAEAP